MHHIITDGWSMSVLLREIGEVYERLSNGREDSLPSLPVQYADFSRWQREAIARDALADQLKYWTNKLQGAQTVLSLPVDRPRNKARNGSAGAIHFRLPQGMDEKLDQLAHAEGATVFMALLAVFQILLWRYTLQDSILIGIPTAGRNDEDLENLIGLFVNTVIIRADLTPDITFRQLLMQVKTNTLEALAQQDVPFEKLVEVLEPVRIIHQNPLFQVMFIFQNAPSQNLEISGIVQEEIELESGAAKFPVSLEIIDVDGLYCTFEYDSDLFDEATIQRIAGHFITLLERVLKAPDEVISKLPMLTAPEVEQFAQWNCTSHEYPRDLCIHTAFEEQAALTPDRIALIDGGRRLSYRDLNCHANHLAHRLIREGVGPGVLIGISLHRSLEMVVALLAVLKAGAAYVPLDPNQPEQRLQYMLQDAGAGVAITRSELAVPFRDHNVQLIFLDDEAVVSDEVANPAIKVSPEELAYVIYTSGSTGKPKGVQGTHRASINRFCWMWDNFPFREDEICCQKTALGFVDSVWEIFGPLLRGVPLVIVPHETLIDPEQFLQLLARHAVTRIVLVPSLLQVLLEGFVDLNTRLPRLRLWTCSGETLAAGLAKRFREAMPNATLLNIYGSAEVAADVTCHVVTAGDAEETIPIGRPINNVQLFLLDRYMNRTPQGVAGEMYVGGDCLSPGYWGKPDLTAERFVECTFEDGRPTRLFRTGDLAKYRKDGEIEYLGRSDNQVKIRGIRVELGEIEAALVSNPMVSDAVVLLTGEPTRERLIAYVVPRSGASPSTDLLRRAVRSKLPEYMVPSEYLVVEAFPMLHTGKVDRKTLAAQTLSRPMEQRRYVAPETETQAQLAAIWCDLLKVEQVGLADNFFQLGGHSLLVMQVIARIRRAFEVEVPLLNLFENPTLAGMADEVEKARASGMRARAPIFPRSNEVAAEASKRTILAQLNQLSETELQQMLQQLLKDKQPSGQALSPAP
jgi:amino acid adenylation domain-containing protein